MKIDNKRKRCQKQTNFQSLRKIMQKIVKKT